MTRQRRNSVAANVLLAAAAATSSSCGVPRTASAFLVTFAPPQPITAPSTSLRHTRHSCGSRSSSRRSGTPARSSSNSIHPHRATPPQNRRACLAFTTGSGGVTVDGLGRGQGMSFAGGSSVGRMSRSGGSTLALQANEARVSPALSRSEEEMDAEWQRILADEGDDDGGDDEEDADDGEEGEEEVSAEELLLGFNVKSADFGDDDGGTERMEEEEPPVIERMPYKQRMKLQKAKEKAWAEKRKTFSPKYIAHLDMVEANRARAAARREKYTKKFFRMKKIYDIAKESEARKEREAMWAQRWPKNFTRSAADLEVGEWVEGKVRNVEKYGAWVDIGVERDGLLHVREMSETFTPKASDVLSTKDKVRVRIKHVEANGCKIGLSMVEEGPREADLPSPPPRTPISISDISPGQQLWGHVERATNFGAYVDVGTEVPGFLHLKEVPERPRGVAAYEVLPRNRRLRVYAKEIDVDLNRIKLTCKRPKSKPRCGPPPALASAAYMEEYDYDDSLLPGRSRASGDNDDQDDDGDGDGDHEEEDWGDEDGWGNEITVGAGGNTLGGGGSKFGVWDYEEGREQESGVDEAAAIAAAEAEEINWS